MLLLHSREEDIIESKLNNVHMYLYTGRVEVLPVERTGAPAVEDTVVVQQNTLHPTPRRNSKNATVQTTGAVQNTIVGQIEASEVVRKREIFMQMIFMVLTPVVVIDALVVFGLSRLKYYKFELHHIKGMYIHVYMQSLMIIFSLFLV